MDNNILINNVNNKNICITKYGDSIYSDLWYCDNKNKICITFTPRGGCSVAYQQYLDLVGLLNDGLDYNPFIHIYRTQIMLPNIKSVNINELVEKKFKFVKFITNPYIRAVSIYRAQTSHNLSFRDYLKQLINNEIDYFNDNDKFHYHPQYIEGEENIITKYIKIDKNETFQINLADGKPYTLDLSKYSSCHHGKRVDNEVFCGDAPIQVINKKLPKTYKYFYDEEIKQMVEKFYEQDIKHYGYSFDDF